VIRLKNVTKTYHRAGAPVDALRDVSLAIDRGEYVALLGPSGSGKSTLLHIVGCLDRPTSGAYDLDGSSVEALGVDDLAETRNRKIGFVFQRFHLMPRLTALENVALPLRFAGAKRREREGRALRLLERMGLSGRADHLPSELSGGEQQRVAIARALANEPPILLADEPTGNLDTATGAEIIALLEELHAEGRTVIVVTHDEGLGGRARRRVRLLDGRVVQ
jgi:putative ABC transport system ATP-binding protein